MARRDDSRSKDRDRDDDRDDRGNRDRETRGTRGRDADRDDDRDRDRGARSERGGGRSRTVPSFSSKAFVSAVGIGPGPGKVYDAKFENYKYSDGQRHVALCLYIERNGEELAEPEPLTMGTGWDIIDGGERVEGRNGQTGLSPSCKLAIFLKALEDLNENEMPTDYFAKASDLIGIDGELISHMMDKIEDRGDRGRGRDRGGDRGGRSSSPKLLVYESVTDAPWLASTSKSKGKPESRRASTRDRDEDRDERPTGKNRSDSRTNGKGDKGDDKYSEIASELLAGLLEDGPLNIKDAADAVHDAAKKDKKYRDEADAIAEAVDQALIDSELAWTVDGKKLVASQPEDDSDKDEKDDKRARR